MRQYEFPFTFQDACIDGLVGMSFTEAGEFLRTNSAESERCPEILESLFSDQILEYLADRYALPDGTKPDVVVRFLRSGHGYLDMLVRGNIVERVIMVSGPSMLSVICSWVGVKLCQPIWAIVEVWKKVFSRKHVAPTDSECLSWATMQFPEELRVIAARVSGRICDDRGRHLEKLTPRSRFVEDLGMDDLDTLNLLSYCEHAFCLELRAIDFELLETVAELVGFLHKRISVSAKPRFPESGTPAGC
jgi:acyl carrier protein